VKAFFLLLFLILLAGGAWIAAPALKKGQPINEVSRTQVFDRFENLLSAFLAQPKFRSVESFVNEKLGLCRVMTGLDPSTPDPLSRIRVIPDARFPFSTPFSLVDNGILCNFPAGGSSILVLPFAPSLIEVRRQPSMPGIFSYRSGVITLFSDQPNFLLDIGSTRLKVTSPQPVSISVSTSNGVVNLAIVSGKVDIVQSHPSGATALFQPILIHLHPGTSLLSDGKLISNKDDVRLMPSGFEPLVPAPPPPAVPAAAPPAPVVPGH
jgi:hypothetical protein